MDITKYREELDETEGAAPGTKLLIEEVERSAALRIASAGSIQPRFPFFNLRTHSGSPGCCT